jgi:O-antigen/teichoic acid export membrane protein
VSETLFDRASKALGWSFLNTAVGRFGTLAIGIMVARILGPREFGTFAVAMVALLAVLSFNELGVGLAIVRWPGDPRSIAPTVATISLVSSCLIYLGCFVGAPVFAASMGNPGATWVIRILTFNVVLDGLTQTPAALLQRGFRQDRKMLVDQVNSWLGTLVTIGCAVGGMGAMSLAVGRITGALVAGVMFVAFSPEPLRFGFDRSAARALLRFGVPLAGSSLVVFAVTSVDQIVVGKVLGAAALGFYVLALNLSNWPVSMLSQPLRGVAPAAFARLQPDQVAMRRTFLSTGRLLAAVTLPVCLLLSGAAQPLVHLLYGGRWLPSAAVLTWLALLGALRVLFEFAYDYFVVLARTRPVFTIQCLWLIVAIPSLVVGAHLDGVAGVAAAQVAVALLVVVPAYLWELRAVGIGVRQVLFQIWPGAAVALVVGLVAISAHRMIPMDLIALVVSGIVMLGAIAAVIYGMRDIVTSLRTEGADA